MENTYQIKFNAEQLITELGKSDAISYCIGRAEGIQEVILEFEGNGEYGILENWETQFRLMIEYWNDVKTEIVNS